LRFGGFGRGKLKITFLIYISILPLRKNYCQSVELVLEFLPGQKVLIPQSAETMVVMAFGEVIKFMDHKALDAVSWFFVSSWFGQMRFWFVLYGLFGFLSFFAPNKV
jgi:hypothetical protein